MISLREQRCLPLILAGFFALLTVWGCAVPINVPPLASEEIPQFAKAGNYPDKEYRIEPGDAIQIRYTYHPDMNLADAAEKGRGTVVRPDGKITAVMVGEIAVAGLTIAELEKLLVERTSDRLRNPEVVVTIASFAERNIYVAGEVGRPGTVPYRKGLSPLQAIVAAGGFLDTAQKDSVILVRTGGSENNLISRKLNLAEAITDGVKEPVFLAPHDVVYVPKTSIAEADLWVKQHVTELFGFLRPSIPWGSFFR
jgi:protein involved in polysaccharide export with SLBB domain